MERKIKRIEEELKIISKKTGKDYTDFLNIYKSYLNTSDDEKIDFTQIKNSEKNIFFYDDLKESKNDVMDKVAILKLNGGLGTTLGCHGPKSLIEVKNGKNFLDIFLEQTEGVKNILLMNSGHTERAIKKYLRFHTNILMFNQSMFPRLKTNHHLSKSFYPPGHGNLLNSLLNENSTILDELERRGVEYLFISNIDNLGATVDRKILNFILEKKMDFLMEVTEKTVNDIKGGSLVDYKDRPHLIELSQVPSEHLIEFKKMKYFNTNSIWLSLKALRSKKHFDLPLIENKKIIKGKKYIQLETAIGSAISHFTNSGALVVKRNRFLPVKNANDLLLLQSNIFIEKNGFLSMNTLRILKILPQIKLVNTKLKDLSRMFSSLPDLTNLTSLTICGCVQFGHKVTLKGSVIIIADKKSEINIPDGAIIEDKIIYGNLPTIDY